MMYGAAARDGGGAAAWAIAQVIENGAAIAGSVAVTALASSPASLASKHFWCWILAG